MSRFPGVGKILIAHQLANEVEQSILHLVMQRNGLLDEFRPKNFEMFMKVSNTDEMLMRNNALYSRAWSELDKIAKTSNFTPQTNWSNALREMNGVFRKFALGSYRNDLHEQLEGLTEEERAKLPCDTRIIAMYENLRNRKILLS